MHVAAIMVCHVALVPAIWAADAPLCPIDLQPQANHLLDEDFPPGQYPGDRLSELKQGDQQLGGISFHIGAGLIEVAGKFVPDLPRRVDGIQIGRHVKRIYILHGARWGAYGGQGGPLGHWVADGTPIGYYEVNYADRPTVAIPIVYGLDVRDWWSLWDDSRPTKRGRVVWTGSNPHLRSRREALHTKTPLRLYMMTWENPHPEALVTSVNLVSLQQTATPFCVALTVEDAPEELHAEIQQLETRLERLRADFAELKMRMDGERQPNEPSTYLFFDGFAGKYSQAWSIRSPNPDSVSLTKRPGMLTITTEQGGIWKGFDGTKNIFLIDNPSANGGNFMLTTRLVGFDPVSNYNQAGLICFDDADNYVKFVLQWDSNQGGRALCSLRESEGGNIHTSYISLGKELDEVWLRIVKKGSQYAAAASRDGRHYRMIGQESWGNGRPAKVGLIAKNGAPPSAPRVDASFDFFAIAPLDKQTLLLWEVAPAATRRDDATRSSRLPAHLSSPAVSRAGGVVFEPPVRLESQGEAIRVESPGYAAPCWADVDQDGRKDLLVGQFRQGKIRVFRHLDGARFGPGEWLQAAGAVAEVPGVW